MRLTSVRNRAQWHLFLKNGATQNKTDIDNDKMVIYNQNNGYDGEE